MSNQAPDVELQLTHAQATFLLRNCLSNMSLGLRLIMEISEQDITREEMIEKAQPYVDLNDQFRDIMQLLRNAGTKEPE